MGIEVVLNGIFSALFVASVIRISTPLIFGAFGGLITEMAGAPNIALEGIMLGAAFTGVVVSALTQNAVYGMLAGVAVGTFLGSLLAFFHLYFETNPILAGIAINVMSSGSTVFLLALISGEKGNSSSLASLVLPEVEIPFLVSIPFLGEAFGRHNVLTYAAFLAAFLVFVLIYKTKLGRHIRAVGENPVAAESVGISVVKMKYIAYALSGLVASFGGVNLSMGYLSIFQRDMTAGRGFIALAAIFLGGKRPLGVLFGAIVFGFAEALSNQIGSLGFPPQWIQMIPYAATILALVISNMIRIRRQSLAV